jgi:hypothetical protein
MPSELALRRRDVRRAVALVLVSLASAPAAATAEEHSLNAPHLAAAAAQPQDRTTGGTSDASLTAIAVHVRWARARHRRDHRVLV